MRLVKFLNEATLTVDLKFLTPVMDKAIKQCVYKPEATILRTLNKLFEPYYIRFAPTTKNQPADD